MSEACSVDGCTNKRRARGYCEKHYARWRTHGDPTIVAKAKPKRREATVCEVAGCGRAPFARTYCTKHYGRVLRYGDPNTVRFPMPNSDGSWTEADWKDWLFARFRRTESGCLEWTGNRTGQGYGRVTYRKEPWYTHRLAYELAHGPIPDGLYVCHHCDNPPCGEPSHLFLGDNQDNLDDMRSKGRGYVPDPKRGSEHPRTRLTDDVVLAIRAAHAGGESQAGIARRLMIERTAVNNICNRKTWKHLP